MLMTFAIFLPILGFVFSLKSEDQQHSNMSNSLRILDINVWSGLDYKGYLKMGEYESDVVREKRYQALITQIKRLDPDIIGIQEANKLPCYATRLADALGYDVFYHVGLGGVRLGPIGFPWNLREGDAILAKKSLNAQFAGRKQLSGGYVGNWLTFHFSDATQIMGVKITFQNQPVFIFVTHWHASLSNSPYVLAKAKELYDGGAVSEEEYRNVLSRIKKGVDWRLSESEKTLEFIRETARDHPFVLMGDFNAESGSGEVRKLLQFGMVDVFPISNPDSPGFTWDPRTNLNHRVHYLKDTLGQKDASLYDQLEDFSRTLPSRIDYIFLGPASDLQDKKLSVNSSMVVMNKVTNGVHASDHYGVFAVIGMNR